jgi:hypothetical protein
MVGSLPMCPTRGRLKPFAGVAAASARSMAIVLLFANPAVSRIRLTGDW